MANLSDEQFQQFTEIYNLMGRQLEALKRIRSSKITGQYNYNKYNNANLYSNRLEEIVIIMSNALGDYGDEDLPTSLVKRRIIEKTSNDEMVVLEDGGEHIFTRKVRNVEVHRGQSKLDYNK